MQRLNERLKRLVYSISHMVSFHQLFHQVRRIAWLKNMEEGEVLVYRFFMLSFL